jgi:thiamine-monophosphate kinase
MIARELDLVRRIRAKAGFHGDRGLILGIGDDCAIFRPRRAEDLLFTTDLLIEGVHFRRETHSAGEIGHKALARGLSDVAAMAAEPRFCLLSLALAPWVNDRWVDAFFTGMLRLAAKWKAPLAGGDLSHADKIACDIVVCGGAPRGRALRRDGARPGDAIYVSGRLGHPWQKYRKPEPRIDFGLKLRGRATSAIDLSDGLSLDLHRLCVASQVAAELDHVPVTRGSTLEQALHGGEDYELLFTMPQKMKPPDGSHYLGRIVRGDAGEIRLHGKMVPRQGYDHFRRNDGSKAGC